MSIRTNPATAVFGSDKEMDAAVRDFVWAEESATNKVIIISGKEGTGKTHLACSLAQAMPVYLIDTEYRAHHVIHKFAKYPFPIRRAICRNYVELLTAVMAIVNRAPTRDKPVGERGAIIIDSGTDLQEHAEKAYLIKTKADKIYPEFLWTEVWAMCDFIVDTCKFSGFDLVLTSRMKERYVGGEGTGQMIPRVYNKLPYKADVMLELSDVRSPITITKPQSLDAEIPIRMCPRGDLPAVLKIALS